MLPPYMSLNVCIQNGYFRGPHQATPDAATNQKPATRALMAIQIYIKSAYAVCWRLQSVNNKTRGQQKPT